MKVIHFPILAASLFVFVSCSQESVELPIQHQTNETTYCRSLDEGLKEADMFFEKMGMNTRSSSRKVKSVETINQNTRSASPESAFYIVNYENNEGFALLSADKRVEPVLAFSNRLDEPL